MRVWAVLRDDGNSALAEESVDSVWLFRRRALSHGRTLGAYRWRVQPFRVRLWRRRR